LPRSRSQRSEVRGQRSEIRGQRSEIRGQRSEVRDQRSEVRDQRSEVRSQKSEIRDQRAEDDGPHPDHFVVPADQPSVGARRGEDITRSVRRPSISVGVTKRTSPPKYSGSVPGGGRPVTKGPRSPSRNFRHSAAISQAPGSSEWADSCIAGVAGAQPFSGSFGIVQIGHSSQLAGMPMLPRGMYRYAANKSRQRADQ
jgi:hypothetical protein